MARKAADFGPRGQDVLGVLDRLKLVDLEGARALGAAWMAADAEARAAAWQQVKSAVAAAGRGGALQRARDEVLRWATTWQGWAWGTYGLEGVPQGLSSADTWAAAAPAAMDAAAALVVADVIDAAAFETLCGPWLAATEGGPESGSGAGPETEPEARPAG